MRENPQTSFFSLITTSYPFHLLKGYCTSSITSGLQFYSSYIFCFISLFFANVFLYRSLCAFFVNFDNCVHKAFHALLLYYWRLSLLHALSKFICKAHSNTFGTNLANFVKTFSKRSKKHYHQQSANPVHSGQCSSGLFI